MLLLHEKALFLQAGRTRTGLLLCTKQAEEQQPPTPTLLSAAAVISQNLLI